MNGITTDFAVTPMSFRGLLQSYFVSHEILPGRLCLEKDLIRLAWRAWLAPKHDMWCFLPSCSLSATHIQELEHSDLIPGRFASYMEGGQPMLLKGMCNTRPRLPKQFLLDTTVKHFRETSFPTNISTYSCARGLFLLINKDLKTAPVFLLSRDKNSFFENTCLMVRKKDLKCVLTKNCALKPLKELNWGKVHKSKLFEAFCFH
ncbi:hypothetical protein DV515_00013315 [Chloebia gouldiae]|uniref:Uncharacterized protein n=1 Tax=Chloebia gouldiae TaxID=44316 RepID=A0A3L8S1B2_CHLGU|nr:hypothetical protein DV515_00013315 [Chloebia gouldiae]